MTEQVNGGPPPIADGTPSPQNLEQFEVLIKRLYEPANLNLVGSIERHLQWHQRSAEGWNMAFALLDSKDDTVTFFGALTLAVKLNIAGKDLTEEEVQALCQRLVALFWKFHKDTPMIAQKIVTCLAIFFMLPNLSAEKCIETLANGYGPSIKEPQPASSIPKTYDRKTGEEIMLNLKSRVSKFRPGQPLSEVLELMRSHKASVALLKFIQALAEEGSKRLADAGSDRKKAATYEGRIEINIGDAVMAMQDSLLRGHDDNVDDELGTQAVNTFATWALFCQKAVDVKVDDLDRMRTLIRPTLVFVAQDVEDVPLVDSMPMDTIADLLSSYPAFFKLEHLQDILQLLLSHTGQQYLANLKGEDETAMPFARLLCAYVDADLTRIVEHLQDPSITRVMEMIHELLGCPGIAAIDDLVIVEMQGIWNTFVEFVVDSSYDTSTKPAAAWHENAKAHILRAVEQFWVRIQYPAIEYYRTWSEDDKKTFQQFRADVQDLFNACHLALGVELLQAFVDMALQALAKQEWTKLEAALFGLYGIAESLDESDHEELITAELMNSQLYPTISNNDPSIPLHVRRTAMRLVGSLGSYFERRPESLPNVLNYLFTSLNAASMAEAASRSIYSLCTTCRGSLKQQLSDFYGSYEQFLGSATATTFTKSKVIGAVAAIAQTLPTDAMKADALTRLLDYVEADAKSALELMAGGNHEQSAFAGECTTACLATIAKSFQETMEVVDLESSPQSQSYWIDVRGAVVQQRIVRLATAMLDILESNLDVVEAVCNMLKAGFSETSLGPFVLQPSVVTGFLTRPQAGSAQLSLVLGTACGFVRAYTPASTPAINTEAQALLSHIASLMQQLGEPRNDPEIAQAFVEVLTRYMPRYTTILVHTQAQVTFAFAIACVAAPEPLPKRAGATFWGTFLMLTSQPPDLQSLLDEVILHFGPHVARVFTSEVAHNSMRSDIEALADPLKKLWSRHPRVRSWFEAALNVSPQEAAQAEDVGLQMVAMAPVGIKYRFLEQMKVARDMQTVRKAMSEFGAACKAASRNQSLFMLR